MCCAHKLFFAVLSCGNNNQSGCELPIKIIRFSSLSLWSESFERLYCLSEYLSSLIDVACWHKVNSEHKKKKQLLIWRTCVSSLHPVRKPSIAKIFSQRAHLNASLLHTCNANKVCTTACFVVLNEVKKKKSYLRKGYSRPFRDA